MDDVVATVRISSTALVAGYGDFFTPPPGKRCVLAIPHYKDGILFKLMVTKNRLVNSSFSVYTPATGPNIPRRNTMEVARALEDIKQGINPILGVMSIKSDIPNIPYTILFSYEDRDLKDWNKLFADMFQLIPPEPDLVLYMPIVGIMNFPASRFNDAAKAQLEGIRTAVRESPTSPPKEIHIRTLKDAEGKSAAWMRHFQQHVQPV